MEFVLICFAIAYDFAFGSFVKSAVSADSVFIPLNSDIRDCDGKRHSRRSVSSHIYVYTYIGCFRHIYFLIIKYNF